MSLISDGSSKPLRICRVTSEIVTVLGTCLYQLDRFALEKTCFPSHICAACSGQPSSTSPMSVLDKAREGGQEFQKFTDSFPLAISKACTPYSYLA